VDPAPVWKVLVFVIIKQPGSNLYGQCGEGSLVAQQLTLTPGPRAGYDVVIAPI
jgi:hypothetical protein